MAENQTEAPQQVDDSKTWNVYQTAQCALSEIESAENALRGLAGIRPLCDMAVAIQEEDPEKAKQAHASRELLYELVDKQIWTALHIAEYVLRAIPDDGRREGI